MGVLPEEIETDRLLLRRWQPADRIPFAALNADPVVMEFFPEPLTTDQSNAAAERIEKHFADNGFGFWAVQIKDHTPFIGFIGLAIPRFESHFTPCVEIGWRLSASFWGNGYATEGASAAMEFAFKHLALKQIVSTTTVGNVRSRRVMEKLGMIYSPMDDFDHPLVAKGHPLQRHVLYRRDAPASA